MNNYVPGYGCSSAKLVIVGEAPGKHEVESGIPFTGPAGQLLNKALAEAGTSRNEVYTTNVCKVHPPNNRLDQLSLVGHRIEDFLPQLWMELETINPNCILAVGSTALEALTGLHGIEKYRGSILLCRKTGQKVVSCIHPAALLHSEGGLALHPWKEFSWIKADIKRAVEQSNFREHKPPERYLHIAQSSNDVVRFLERYQNKEHVYLDVETFKTFAQCIGLAFTPQEALSIPLFNIGDQTGEIPASDMSLIWLILSEFLHDTKIKIAAQNAKFDEKRCRQLGLAWHDCWFDTSMGWHMLFPEFPKSLQFISSVLTEEPYYKDEGKEFPSADKAKNFRQWLLYNAKDAAVEVECGEKIIELLKEQQLYDFFFEKVMPLHRIYSNMEDVGILVDRAVHKALQDKYGSMLKAKQAKLIENITEGDPQLYETYKNFNVMSNGMKNQVAKLIFGFMKLPLRKDTGDDTLKSLANNNCKRQKDKDILLGILEVRKVRKTIGTYLDAVPSKPDVTRFGAPSLILSPQLPRIHTQCNLNATETYRTGTGILKPPISIDKEGISLQGMTKHEDVTLDVGGADLRSMFIADEGYVFLEPDLAQAEDRVVCVLAKDWDALKSYERTEFKKNKNGLKDDRHTMTACAVSGLDFENITDWERQIGKKTRHAGNYNMKKHTHMLQLAKAGIFVSEYAAGKQLERFHAENPKIQMVFHNDIQRALVDNDCTLVTPHGYKRTFFNRMGDELYKEAYAFIPQNVVTSQVKFAMQRISVRLKDIYQTKFFFLEESHDSFLALCDELFVDMVSSVIKEELERPINFATCTLSRDYNLVIPSDLKIGKRWIDFSADFQDGMRKYTVKA